MSSFSADIWLPPLPDSWSEGALENYLDRIVGGGTPSRKQPRFWDGSIAWASVKDFPEGENTLSSTKESITEKGLHASSASLVEAGVPIVCTRMSVGRAARFTRPVAINQDLKALYPNEQLRSDYLLRVIRFLHRRIEALSVGSTVKGIRTGDLLNLPVRVPSATEQRRIARVLDAVDAAIRHTDRVVGKLDHVRQGLLHDLLTRGLTPDGRLRDPDAHPEQFRDSPLGRIPEEWEVTRMREVVPDAEYGISSSLDDETGIPVLRMNNLKGGEADTSSLKYSDSPVAKSKLLEPLDVLFNRTNSIEHVGRTGIWRSQLPKASFASYLVRLNPDEDRLHPEYLNYWLNLPQTQVNIRRFATHGVSQANINPTNLRKSYIALPDLDEQERIIHRVRTLERRSKKERDRQSKLQNLKRGLMRDLLTGAVRITDDVERRVADAIGQPVS